MGYCSQGLQTVSGRPATCYVLLRCGQGLVVAMASGGPGVAAPAQAAGRGLLQLHVVCTHLVARLAHEHDVVRQVALHGGREVLAVAVRHHAVAEVLPVGAAHAAAVLLVGLRGAKRGGDGSLFRVFSCPDGCAQAKGNAR